MGVVAIPWDNRAQPGPGGPDAHREATVGRQPRRREPAAGRGAEERWRLRRRRSGRRKRRVAGLWPPYGRSRRRDRRRQDGDERVRPPGGKRPAEELAVERLGGIDVGSADLDQATVLPAGADIGFLRHGRRVVTDTATGTRQPSVGVSSLLSAHHSGQADQSVRNAHIQVGMQAVRHGLASVQPAATITGAEPGYPHSCQAKTDRSPRLQDQPAARLPNDPVMRGYDRSGHVLQRRPYRLGARKPGAGLITEGDVERGA